MTCGRLVKWGIGAAMALLCVITMSVGQASAEDISLRLGWKLTGYHLPFFWAKAKGYYAAEGLNVTIEPGAGSGKTVALIGGQHDDIGEADYMLMAEAASKGMPVKGIFGIVQAGAWAVISYADKPIKTPQELIGKSIAMTADHKPLFDLLLAVNHIPEDKVHIRITNAATRNTVFMNGKVDGFVSIIIGTPLNLVAMAKEGKGKPVYFMPFAKFGVSPLGEGVMANEAVIKKRPQMLTRFVRATARAFTEVMKPQNTNEAVDIAMKMSDTPPAQREAIKLGWLETLPRLRTANDEGKPVGWMSEKDWQKCVEILLKTKKIDKAFPAKTLYTNEFVPKS